jgi:hypothetical protein
MIDVADQKTPRFPAAKEGGREEQVFVRRRRRAIRVAL